MAHEILKGLNTQQQTAITGSFNRNTVVLAGAGAGKTKVLITRIQYIMDYYKADPESIMAITFTNKAAKEILARAKKVTPDANKIWTGTYHSICIRLLRMFGEDIGLEDFTILDPYNAKKAVQDVMIKLELVYSKQLSSKFISKMSSLKNDLIVPKKYRESKLKSYKGDFNSFTRDPEIDFINFYSEYQKENFKNQNLDFDDIILYTILLLKSSKNAQEFVRRTFKYIHADEVQDSNTSNIVLLTLLSLNCNLYLVGDIDQSIYGFRNAKPEYIAKLANDRTNYNLYKLEQNYRSTKTIVDASNNIIVNNDDRIDKVCFSAGEVGDRITHSIRRNEYDEAEFILNEIKAYKRIGKSLSSMMILYRTNSQSRVMEEAFIKENIPYTIVGSLSFNDRAEIKDCLAFLRVAANKRDKQSLKRALSTLDGIGKKAIEDITNLMDVKGDAYSAIQAYKPNSVRAKKSLEYLINVLSIVDNKPMAVLSQVVDYFKDKFIAEGTPKAIERLENIEELVSMTKEKQDSGVALKDFVSQMDLLSSKDKSSDLESVTMMTIHASKGLESEIVFITGANEGIMPHKNSMSSSEMIEEERRLAYVAVTRAMKKLYITGYSMSKNEPASPSRFVGEIANSMIEQI